MSLKSRDVSSTIPNINDTYPSNQSMSTNSSHFVTSPSSGLRKSQNSLPLNSSLLTTSTNSLQTSTNQFGTLPLGGMLIGAKPGSIVERHIGSTLGDVVRLSPSQTGILRRFLANGSVEFLLGNNVVKLEAGYELRINETIAIRRRQELPSRIIQGQEIKTRDMVVLLQILANLICKDEEYSKKLHSLYTVNNQVVKAGYIMAIYPEGIVISANLVTPEDVSSWIFIGDKDLNDIYVIDQASNEDPNTVINKEWKRLKKLLSLDAGMAVTFGVTDTVPKTIESIWWSKGNVLGRKAVFDNGRACVSILSLTPYENTLKRTTYDSPPLDRAYLRLYTEFQNPDGLLFAICGYDDRGVIANFKPIQLSGKTSDSCGRCWVPYSYFDNSQFNESVNNISNNNQVAASISQIPAPAPQTSIPVPNINNISTNINNSNTQHTSSNTVPSFKSSTTTPQPSLRSSQNVIQTHSIPQIDPPQPNSQIVDTTTNISSPSGSYKPGSPKIPQIIPSTQILGKRPRDEADLPTSVAKKPVSSVGNESR